MTVNIANKLENIPTVTFIRFSPTGAICLVIPCKSRVTAGNTRLIKSGNSANSFADCDPSVGIIPAIDAPNTPNTSVYKRNIETIRGILNLSIQSTIGRSADIRIKEMNNKNRISRI